MARRQLPAVEIPELDGLFSAVRRVTIDCSQQPKTGGNEIKVSGRYFCVRSVPPGISAVLKFHSQEGDQFPIWRPETFAFRGRTGKPETVFVDYTPIDLSGGGTVPGRGSIEILIADELLSLPSSERVEVVPAPTLGGETNQFTVTAAAAKISSSNTNTEEVMVTAYPTNTQPFFIGFDGSVTVGNGDAVFPGMVKTYPVDRASRLWVIGTLNDMGSWALPRSRR